MQRDFHYDIICALARKAVHKHDDVSYKGPGYG